MKPIIQKEKTGCGIASSAAVAGISYAQAKIVANGLGISADFGRMKPKWFIEVKLPT